MTPAADLKEKVTQLRATRHVAPVADWTLLSAAVDGACPKSSSGNSTVNLRCREKSEASTVASVEMLQLSMKAWCALN